VALQERLLQAYKESHLGVDLYKIAVLSDYSQKGIDPVTKDRHSGLRMKLAH